MVNGSKFGQKNYLTNHTQYHIRNILIQYVNFLHLCFSDLEAASIQVAVALIQVAPYASRRISPLIPTVAALMEAGMWRERWK